MPISNRKGLGGGGGGGGAPTTSKYLLQQADGLLPNAQAMGALGTGLVKNTTTSGAQSIAVAETDYSSPLTFSGALSRSVNNVTIAAGAITGTEIAAAIKDAAAATASLRTLGTGAAQAAAGNDSRLSDSRAPNGSAGGDLTGTYPSPTLGTNVVTNAKFRQGAALSIVGVTGNATANVADIAAGTDGDILRRSGTTLGFGKVGGGSFTGFVNTNIPVGNASGGLDSSSITLASNLLTHAASSSGGTVQVTVGNTSDTASSHALVRIESGGTSAGSPKLEFKRGSTTVLTGYDGATGLYKIAGGTTFPTSGLTHLFAADPVTGNIAIGQDPEGGTFRRIFNFTRAELQPTIFRVTSTGGAGARMECHGYGDHGLQIIRYFGGGWSVQLDDSETDDPLKISFNDNAGSEPAPGTNDHTTFTRTGNLILGAAALATTATNGFLYIPSCPGTPTGTPTSYTGRVPLVWDSTNTQLYVYSGGAWQPAHNGA